MILINMLSSVINMTRDGHKVYKAFYCRYPYHIYFKINDNLRYQNREDLILKIMRVLGYII